MNDDGLTHVQRRALEGSPEFRAAINNAWNELNQPFEGRYFCMDANGVYCTDPGFTGDCPHERKEK